MIRAKGAGSIYLRKDGLWVASVELPSSDGKRHRKTISSKDREVVVRRLAEINAVEPGDEYARQPTRQERLTKIRQMGTHSDAEWYALVREAPRECRYCGTELNVFNSVKDHKRSVVHGGSDRVENLQLICWECNIDKGDLDADEFVYRGPRPRPFRVLPARRAWYQGIEAVRRARQG